MFAKILEVDGDQVLLTKEYDEEKQGEEFGICVRVDHPILDLRNTINYGDEGKRDATFEKMSASDAQQFSKAMLSLADNLLSEA